MSTIHMDPLPPGIGLSCVGSIAQLTFADEAAERRYRGIVGKGFFTQASAYYTEHWIRTLGPTWNTLIQYLRYLALNEADPAPTIPQLAAACGISEQTIRRMLAFWERPEWMGDQVEKWPRREWKRWLGVRGYIPRISAPAQNAPYRFTVLLADPIHPNQRPEFAEFLAGEQAELSLWDGESNHTVVPGPSNLEGQTDEGTISPSKLEGQGSEGAGCTSILEGQTGVTNHTLVPGPSNLEGQPRPPHTPHEPCHAMPERHGMAPSTGSESGTAEPLESDAEHAAAILASLQMPRNAATRLLGHHPEASRWVRQWHAWMQDKPDVENPAGFLSSMVRRACRGDDEAREAPWEYVAAEHRRAGGENNGRRMGGAATGRGDLRDADPQDAAGGRRDDDRSDPYDYPAYRQLQERVRRKREAGRSTAMPILRGPDDGGLRDGQ